VADRWKVRVVYDEDGTCVKEIAGHLVTAQLLPGGRGLIQTYDAHGDLVASFQASVTYSIERSRIDG